MLEIETKDTQRCATVRIREAAQILGIGINQAYAAARSGELPTIRIGGRILVSRAVLEKILEGPLMPPTTNL